MFSFRCPRERPGTSRGHLQTVSFFNLADNTFVVAFELQNVSEEACAPEPPVFFPGFVPNQAAEAKPFVPCAYCEDPLPAGQYRGPAQLVLNPGELGNQTYRWKTVPPSPEVHCLRLEDVGGAALVVAPSLFKPVCSNLAVSRVHPGRFVPPGKDADTSAADSRPAVLVLSAARPSYDDQELFPLQVRLAELDAASSLSDECPALFLRVRSPDGGTRFDATRPAGFKTCPRRRMSTPVKTTALRKGSTEA